MRPFHTGVADLGAPPEIEDIIVHNLFFFFLGISRDQLQESACVVQTVPRLCFLAIDFAVCRFAVEGRSTSAHKQRAFVALVPDSEHERALLVRLKRHWDHDIG